MSSPAQNRVSHSRSTHSGPIFTSFKVPNKTLYTTDASQRGGSGDIGVEGVPVHVHPIITRRAKQVVPKSQTPIRLIGLVRNYPLVRNPGSFYSK